MLSRRRVLQGLAALPGAVLAVPAAGQTNRPRLRWVVFYGADAPAGAFDPYSLVVLDRDEHPDVQPLTDARKSVFGYISLGEASDYRAEFREVESWGILRGENPSWPGSHFVDVRDVRWPRLVVEQLVPAILRRGFNGLFLDTLDNPIELERRDPTANHGMTQSAARLVKAIRLHWPDVPLILNRGYGILDDVAGVIDYVLGESVYADYQFDERRYRLVETETYREQVALLQRAAGQYPHLTVLTLDYWDPADHRTITEIYRVQRQNGFEPYVATVELDRIVPEPGA